MLNSLLKKIILIKNNNKIIIEPNFNPSSHPLELDFFPIIKLPINIEIIGMDGLELIGDIVCF